MKGNHSIASGKVGKFVLAVALLAVAAGCVSTGDRQVKLATGKLVELPRGISLAELETQFGARAAHQFTTTTNGQTLRCVSYGFKISDVTSSYYFLFRGDALEKVVEPPLLEYRNVPGYTIRITDNPDGRVAKVLDLPDLRGDELIRSLSRDFSVRKKHRSASLLPLFVILAPIGPVLAADASGQRNRLERAAKKFDPFLVTLGMDRSAVEAYFGPPVLTTSSGSGQETSYYGYWVAVVFKDERVATVFSGDFFDWERVRRYLSNLKNKQ